MKLYKPKWYQKSIYDIDYHKLKEKGIKYLIFDLDNTLGKIDEEECSLKAKDFLDKLKTDFTILIVSNNSKNRVLKFCKGLTDDVLYLALKPTSKTFGFIRKYTKNMQEVCMIGDQIVTDIITGNRFKMMTILVDPIENKDMKITSLNRFIERRLISKLKLKKGEYYEEN